ncbi:glycine-rich protein, putative [Trichomonas vaginalis G3]|uniref:receptor protein-tyrosine kinase n=1 Tax=Trichomonas vaginalis (strain ATCC PRA-98 / G3) TaxID=412133 RepID=A2EBV5_TRIV3|nr:glycine-rich protein family [Trichomonas vaginalis G3]EAY09823.1 glycine-rich protein, putative [Trichomonas vaginalis G3]KAI5505952.1 glycine-rich protein family [Trichomonas vaginalis G3]|eukprot:XP_001322046.1 glycine-rich protein [Trichomonas vaginalis G3]
MISYELLQKDGVVANENVSVNGNQYIFDYPCENTSFCTKYVVKLPRGTYQFELYGASGGSVRGRVSSYRDKNKNCILSNIVEIFHGNAECFQKDSIGGAGGYLSATLKLQSPITTFLTIGGRGVYGKKSDESATKNCFKKENMQPGGYGGGGSSANYVRGTGSGGGQTAVKFHENDLWHRVLVSGAGGGCDDSETDDGSGGAGGNITAQGWFDNGNYVGTLLANSTFGFSFGQGEAARYGNRINPYAVLSSRNEDNAGAGGDWFGGFASQSGYAGAGGGSSFALTKDTVIPPGNISAYDEFYTKIDSKPYAFNINSEYLFEKIIHMPGIWEGNGRAVITILQSCVIQSCFRYYNINYIEILIFNLI